MRGPAWWTLYSTGGRAFMSILGGPSIIEDEEELGGACIFLGG
jgi:hypothetical protein